MRDLYCAARLAVPALAAAGLVACATTEGGGSSAPTQESAPRLTTHVYTGNCIFRTEGEAAPLVAAILPNLISQSLNRIGNTLEASAKEHAWTVKASTNNELSTTQFPRCVQVVRGQFFPARADSAADWTTGTPYEGQLARMNTNGIFLAAKPDFFFEGVFRSAASNSQVKAIVPVAVGYEEPIGGRAFRSDSTRHSTMTFAFHGPGKADTDATNPSTELILGALPKGSFARFDQSCIRAGGAAGNQTGNAPVPAQPGGMPPATGGAAAPVPTPAPAPALGGRACAEESRWFPLALSADAAPMSLTVAVSEVQGASEFLAFVADVFKDSKEGIETVAKQALISSEREAARLAAAEAENTLTVAFVTAQSEALEALDTCSKDGSIANVGSATTKQLGANLAAEKAGRRKPFPQLIAMTTDPAAAQAACLGALSNFTPT